MGFVKGFLVGGSMDKRHLGLSTASWSESVGLALLDEAEKAPAVFEKMQDFRSRDKAVRYLRLCCCSECWDFPRALMKMMHEALISWD
jgi:hypothetical protein